MKKPADRKKLRLAPETVRRLTATDAIAIVGGLHITDGTNATICLPQGCTPASTRCEA